MTSSDLFLILFIIALIANAVTMVQMWRTMRKVGVALKRLNIAVAESNR
ncbi:hypothetical protein ABIF78_007755 [Bradyrhizobium japonicum]|jgi:hypothetical protein